MKTFMFILKKLASIFCWIGAIFGVIGLFKAQASQVPYSLFSAILWFYWGCVLWKNDKRIIAINGFVFALLVIAIFVAEFVICMIIASVTSGCIANFAPEVTGWIFTILMSFCLFALAPSRLLPKRFYINEETGAPLAETITDVKSEKMESSPKSTLNQFEESDHTRYMPK